MNIQLLWVRTQNDVGLKKKSQNYVRPMLSNTPVKCPIHRRGGFNVVRVNVNN